MVINSFRGEFAFLSNFAPCEIEFEGIKFRSTEAAFQAAKTLDMEERRSIATMSPVAAKNRGRQIKLRPNWESIKLSVMENINRQKFSQEPYRTRLLDTYPHELIEGNWWNDKFWGVCNGEGKNHLGIILMKIRSELRIGVI